MAGGNGRSWPEPTIKKYEADFLQMVTSQSEENLMEKLPSEVLLKILSHLDAASLSVISHVSKVFHRLAADEVSWQRIYESDFGSRTWRPTSPAAEAARRVDPVEEEEEEEEEDRAAGYWKKMYFRTMAGQDVNNWMRERRHVSPHTGLPQRTGWTLKNLKVSWQLTLCGGPGQKVTVEPSRVDFFESSAVVHFTGGRFPRFLQIRSLSLHGVRKETARSPRAARPGWRSLVFTLDVKTQPSWLLGEDGLVTLRHLRHGVTIGSWRCEDEDAVAFIMVSLHFHQLVEKSLLGSPVCSYSEPVDLPPVDHSDPESGLHGYSLHLVLHNNATKIMSRTFPQLRCHTVQDGLLELRVIDRNNLSQHRSLSGGIELPWSSERLEGSVENCCILTLTLLDEFQKPFWCVSSSVCVAAAERPLSPDYGDEHFLLRFQEPGAGRLRMELVRLAAPRQFLVIGLVVQLPVLKVNERFGRAH